MSLLQSILMGIIQGATEFLPVSSSGHLALFKIIFNVNTETGLLFDTMLHLGTLVAVCIVYWKDVRNLIVAAFQLLFDIIANFKTWISNKKNGEHTAYRRLINSAYKKFVVLILITTIPTGIMGVAFSSLIERASQTLLVPGICLVITAILLLISDTRPSGHKKDLCERRCYWCCSGFCNISWPFPFRNNYYSLSDAWFRPCLRC